MKSKKYQSGFILVEFIISLILIGIIGVFTSLFIYTGVKGYIDAKDNTEAALKAQVALDRIRLELRDASEITSIAMSTIQYTHETLPNPRTLSYSPDQKRILIQTPGSGGPVPLLDKVSSFTLAMGTANLDGIDDGAKEEISNIGITFQIGNIGKIFRTDVYPRNMLKEK